MEPEHGRMELDNDFPTRKIANRPEDRNQKASISHRMWNIPHHITLALIKALLLKIIHNGSKSGQCVVRIPNKTEKENEKKRFHVLNLCHESEKQIFWEGERRCTELRKSLRGQTQAV